MSPRPLLLLAAISLLAARSASAADTFSNIEGTYDNRGYVISSLEDVGYRFTSGLTGTLAGFTAAINNGSAAANTPLPFTFSLHANSGADTLGALLGVYPGSSTGFVYTDVDRLYTTVDATGLQPILAAGSDYWLVASSEENLIWSWVDAGIVLPTYFTNSSGTEFYGLFNAGSFSVQVQSVPEPSTIRGLLAGAAIVLRGRGKRHRDFGLFA